MDASRRVERLLLDYLCSLHVSIINAAGEPFVDIVRHYEAEEAVTAKLSLEQLAAHLVQELS